ncbi:MAG TPA: Maf family protein [Alphaproteobacteria bacterium]|nr:Maf family protein [Alphaproteobacteria bacterium]
MSGLTLEFVVLASGSASRRAMFEAAGINAILDKPDVDEDSLKRDSAGLSAERTAARLARAKVDAVAPRHRGRIVIGGDQMLECDGEWFDKPVARAGAAEHLRRLSGRTHRLISAAVAVRDGQILWEGIDTAELTMRSLSADFIDAYLDAAGDRVLSSVGAYQVEGLGIQLFSEIRGDHFTILGLPLLPLLDVLRREGVLRS